VIKLILISTVLIGIAVLALAVKMFLIKGGQFTKSCSSIDEKGNRVPCTCKNNADKKCENYEKHHGVENEEEM